MEYLDFIEKIRGKREKDTFERAENVLPEVENYVIGYFYRSFKQGKLTYQELEQELNELMFTLEPILEKPSIYKKEELKSYTERKNTKSFINKDIRGLLLSNRKYKNIIFYYDKPIIKIMADYGDDESIKSLQEITKIERQSTPYYRKIGSAKKYI